MNFRSKKSEGCVQIFSDSQVADFDGKDEITRNFHADEPKTGLALELDTFFKTVREDLDSYCKASLGAFWSPLTASGDTITNEVDVTLLTPWLIHSSLHEFISGYSMNIGVNIALSGWVPMKIGFLFPRKISGWQEKPISSLKASLGFHYTVFRCKIDRHFRDCSCCFS